MRIVRFVLLLLAFAAFIVALAAAVAAALTLAKDGTLFAKPLGAVWREQHLLSLQLFQVGVERKLGLDALWLHVFQPMLGWPPVAVAAAFAALGFVLARLARLFRRR